ncbi:MAG: hypothetical protein V4550_14395 [Gemmatimonadota bacterium]
MSIISSTGQPSSSVASPRERRGVALVFVLVFVMAMAALAMGSIFMASNANLLAKSYDRERDLRYAAEAALAIGKSRVNADPSILVMRTAGQLDTIILNQAILTGADNQPLAGIKVSVYVGPTGSTSGQFGRFSSIVAEARDTRGNGFIRRLELTQESFAKFAYWSNSESNSSTTIFFNNNDELWGPVWSNDTISIGSGGATFHDEVGTAFFVAGASYGTFSKGKKEYQKAIALPSVAVLSNLQTIAASSNWDFDSFVGATSNPKQLRTRIEFVAVDLDSPFTGDSTDLDEGFFRIFEAKNGLDAMARGDWPTGGPPPSLSNVDLCGDWHWTRTSTTAAASSAQLTFFPASVHNTSWFNALVKQGIDDQNPSWTNTQVTNAANAEQTASLKTIMQHASARCYLAGDPHLVATERVTNSSTYIDPTTSLKYPTLSDQKGGTDTTFTFVGANGNWKKWTDTPGATITATGRSDAKYLYPIDRLFNNNAKGVIYFDGNVGVSGTLNGRITLYAKGDIVLLDDLRYANDPVKGVCRDILGIISDKDILIADNAINTPQLVASSVWNANDDDTDMTIHAVMMALGNAFGAEDYDTGPTNVNGCDGTNNGRGCIYLSGGIIQKSRGAVGRSDGTGYAKRYSYDHCAVVNPPPYFPTTGRFQENRYLELDPAGFNHTNYFKSLTPDP